MSGAVTLLYGATALLYTVAAVLHLLHIVRRDVERLAGWTTRSGFIAHTGCLLLLVLGEGHLPLYSLTDFSLLFCWLLMSAYVGLSSWLRSEAAGSFLLPVIAGALVLTLAAFDRPGQPGSLSAGFLLWHAGVALLAYLCLFLSFLAAALYLFQERNLRRKRWGPLYYRLPSLEALDLWSARFVWLGLPLLTLGIGTGLAVARHEWDVLDPKILVTGLVWLLYLGYLLMRQLRGWGGRWAAWWSVLGLIGLLLNWFLVNLLSGVHRFGI
jgi:ABC-type transport system involved in cytochrome c biogenesis permease subunit